MKLFDKAILKLAAIYTAILLSVCIGFSASIYSTSQRDLPQSILPRAVFRLEVREDVETFIRDRDRAMQNEILVRLIILNLVVLVAGAIVSYFLARWTLAPIQKNMDEQSEFVSNASHELRTPLTVMRMENEVILRDPATTKSDLTNQIQSNLEEIDKLQTLTDRLLKISIAEILPLTNFRLTPTIQGAIDRNLSQATTKQITIKNQVKKTATVHANPEALTEIIAILLENAIKYSPDNSQIIIAHTDHQISIVDQGYGIPESDLPHIFKRFYRADKSHTSEGYGLGLSLATHLATKMQMHLTATNNTPSPGATFALHLA